MQYADFFVVLASGNPFRALLQYADRLFGCAKAGVVDDPDVGQRPVGFNNKREHDLIDQSANFWRRKLLGEISVKMLNASGELRLGIDYGIFVDDFFGGNCGVLGPGSK